MTEFPERLTALQPFWGVWVLDGFIGEGSYGKVFRIRREEMGKTTYAALKWITLPKNRSELDEYRTEGLMEHDVQRLYRENVSRFREEIDLMSQLRGNSHIVNYEDHLILERKDEIGWDILIRMELLTPLNQRFREGMTVGDVVKLGLDLCDALALCAKVHVIHRDIKPDNIFISQFGDYKLGDFGVARSLDETATHLSKQGTPVYMAPEVYLGKGKYDATVDLYSLGLVMHRLLNRQRLPFLPMDDAVPTHTERNVALETRLRGTPIPQPVDGGSELAKVICKVCSADPRKRYRTAEEMRDALQKAAEKTNLKKQLTVNPTGADLDSGRSSLHFGGTGKQDGRNLGDKVKTQNGMPRRGRVTWLWIIVAMFSALIIGGFGMKLWMERQIEPRVTTNTIAVESTATPTVVTIATPVPTATPTVKPASTPTHTPTSTPAPTLKPKPTPTSTPKPTPKPTKTSAPISSISNLTAAAQDSSSISVSWENNKENIVGSFRCTISYKTSDASIYTTAATTSMNSYLIKNLYPDTLYNIRVSAGGSNILNTTVKTLATFSNGDSQFNNGDIVYYGHYEQDNNSGNGKEAIAWKVMDVENEKALLLSESDLDCQPYNSKMVPVTWETCTLRTWLNDDFLNSAFSNEEQKSILITHLKNENNTDFGVNTSGGNDTNDKVFLFSIAEIHQYFHNVYEGDDDIWWLRSPGSSPSFAANMLWGSLNSSGDPVDGSFIANGLIMVRPAIWVDLSSSGLAQISASNTSNTDSDQMHFGNKPGIAIGLNYAVAIKPGGTVVATSLGGDDYGQCNVQGWTSIVQVAAGNNHTLGLRLDGTVVATGDNSAGQCEVGTWKDIIQIVAGIDCSVGLQADGRTVVCGEIRNLTLDSAKKLKEISLNGNSLAGIYTDGTVAISDYLPVKVRDTVKKWKGIMQFCLSEDSCMALNDQGEILCAGFDTTVGEDWKNIVCIDSSGLFYFGLAGDGGMHEYGYHDWYGDYLPSFRNYYLDQWTSGNNPVYGFVVGVGVGPAVVRRDSTIEVSGDSFVEYRIREEWSHLIVAPMRVPDISN